MYYMLLVNSILNKHSVYCIRYTVYTRVVNMKFSYEKCDF